MSEFFDHEAEVSEGSEDDEVREDIQRNKKRNKKSRQVDSSDDSSEEEEEDDPDRLQEEMKDLINDDDEESGDSEEEIGRGGQKRDHDDEEEIEEDLEDDDYDLIEENLGRKIQRKRKLKRVRRLDDDDDDEEEEQRQRVDERRLIEEQIFNDDDDDVSGQQNLGIPDIREQVQRNMEQLNSDESEDEDDQFIVDDQDRPIHRPRERHSKYTDSALQSAQELFGTDFDYDEIANYDENGDYDEEVDDEEYEDGDDEREMTQVRRRMKKKSIHDLYEPAELERSHLTEADNEIRNTDLPERFQLRGTPITNCEEAEIRDEAEWIYRHVFDQDMITKFTPDNSKIPFGGVKPRSVILNIQHVLQFIRNDFLEVPFIAFYRREYFSPELDINDLWLIYRWDEKWCQLQERKRNLLKMYENLREYQLQIILNCGDNPLPDNFRRITDKDIRKLQNTQSVEEYNDCFLNFQLHHSSDVPLIKNFIFQQKQEERKRKKEAKRLERQNMSEDMENSQDPEEEYENDTEAEEMEFEEIQLAMKRISVRKDPYTVCMENGIGKIVERFGLTAEQFGENLSEGYAKHELKQESLDLSEIAKEHVSKKFDTPEKVMDAATFMLGRQIACDVFVRKTVRHAFYERAKVNAACTKNGHKEIDENHPCYTFKYLRNKPIATFSAEQFLLLHQAVKDGLMEMSISIDEKDAKESYLDEIKTLFMKDEYSNYILNWNSRRAQAIEIALNKFIFPYLIKEITNRVLAEGHFVISNAVSRKMASLISMGPFVFDPKEYQAEDDEDFSLRSGLRIMGFAFDPYNKEAGFVAMIDDNGEVTDFLKLEFFLLKRENRFLSGNERVLRDKDREKLQRFIRSKKPHAVALGCDMLVTRTVMDEFVAIVQELNEREQFPLIPIEYMDTEMSIVYMNSKRSVSDFPNYPTKLRQAISLARRLKDPLIEFAQLCSADEDILCLKYHPLQEHLSKEELQNAVYQEFIIRVNELGVDLNRCLLYSHTTPLVQFICGFGPRKAAYLLRTLKKQSPPLLENRTQLVQNCNVGKVVFINCAGFIKIDTTQMADSGTETYIEVLDSTRVHPEGYEWARKMAVDALDYDDDSDNHPAQALEEILLDPAKLRDLDLDEFAKELQRQGLGLKKLTLYDIRNELTDRYVDRREPYQKPSMEDVFSYLTGETQHTLFIGKMVLVKVNGIMRRRPKPDQINQAQPIRSENGLWCCPFCMKNDLKDLNAVWQHFDTNQCAGQAFAVKCKLDNGLFGMIPLRFLSDKDVKDPESRVKPGMNIYCRVLKVIIDRYTVELTCRSSDLNDEGRRFKKPRDSHYDYDYETSIKRKEEEKKKKAAEKPRYMRRAIVHPNFHNIDFRKSEKMLNESEIGEAVIRPSSKGENFLALSFKVYDGIHSHVEIREEQKATAFSLGSKLMIGKEEYEDLDEIIARYVQPMASFIRDLIAFKYFKPEVITKKDISTIANVVKEEKQKTPNRIPYFISPFKDNPGVFLLTYMPSREVFHEFISVTPDGYRFRKNNFKDLNALFKWFKLHYQELSTYAQPSPKTMSQRQPVVPGSEWNFDQNRTPNMSMPPPPVPGRAASRNGELWAGLVQNEWAQQQSQPSRSRTAATSGIYPDPSPRIRTPAHNTPGASSSMSISPMINDTRTPKGDQTPLVDEWSY